MSQSFGPFQPRMQVVLPPTCHGPPVLSNPECRLSYPTHVTVLRSFPTQNAGCPTPHMSQSFGPFQPKMQVVLPHTCHSPPVLSNPECRLSYPTHVTVLRSFPTQNASCPTPHMSQSFGPFQPRMQAVLPPSPSVFIPYVLPLSWNAQCANTCGTRGFQF